ncbi:methyltransferase domain-containing protein [Streptomyces sp. MBT65]|uniref:methyltransferase domain-containing protein n=1 Tax=Streptomyces sp. MBT65 TaxID=1488395 RepID=UPI001909ECEE|nr:methyltransferase domain-containing protein [Streptomyces sp. MBT65]MBK3576538.1 methyltransferase domain-containing protein [Streptomyces sp. MBT65]
MSETNETLHDRFIELADLPAEGSVVDLGCGAGPALAAFARRHPKARVIGFDREAESLAKARERLRNHGGSVQLASADLREKLPLDDASVDVVISSNLLECLPAPGALLGEVWRVLRPGGRAVLSHSDFDALVISGAPIPLDRKIVHAFADDAPPWMDSSDGRMGRKLPGLVQTSPLERTHVETLVTQSTELAGHAARRVGDIRGALRATAMRGLGRVDTVEVEEWFSGIQQAAVEGRFFFAETAVVVAAHRV